MILCNPNLDFDAVMFNPSITLHESAKLNRLSFPDPNSYFVLSDAGKLYTIVENTTVLLNPNKGYYEQVFSITNLNTIVNNIAKELLIGTKPIEGDAKVAFELAIIKSGKKNTLFKNRL